MAGFADRLAELVTRFSADASHELRTPITVMRTRVELVLRHPRTDVEYLQTLQQLNVELVGTSALLENLLLLSRADSGAELPDISRTNLDQVIGEAVSQLSDIADERVVALRFSAGDTPVWIDGDRQLLKQLFLILIDNAVKYTQKNGEVNITLSRVDGTATICVTDTGLGIAYDDLTHIFDRFYRADKSRSRKSGGSGLGLSIGRWIAEAHGGSIQVESTLGAGSTFQVALPVARDSRN